MKSVMAGEYTAPPAHGPKTAEICGITPDARVLRKKISAYHTYFFCKETLVHDDITLDSDGTLKYGILLPLFDYNNERRELVVKSKMYTLVFSNWTEINYKNDIGLFNNKDWYYYRIAANS